MDRDLPCNGSCRIALAATGAGRGDKRASTWLSKNSPQSSDIQGEKAEGLGLHLTLAIGIGCLAVPEACPPFRFLLRRACSQHQLVQLVVAQEYYLPRVPGRVALDPCNPPVSVALGNSKVNTALGVHTSTIVDFFQLDVCQSDTGLDRIHLVGFASYCKAKPFSIQESNHVLPIHPVSGLPANVEDPTELDMTE